MYKRKIIHKNLKIKTLEWVSEGGIRRKNTKPLRYCTGLIQKYHDVYPKTKNPEQEIGILCTLNFYPWFSL